MEEQEGAKKVPPPPEREATSTVGSGHVSASASTNRRPKPPFRVVEDDSKPILRDPLLRSNPMETEQAVLRLPPFPNPKPGMW